MTQAYSDPKRASDPHALPDVEVFRLGEGGEGSPKGWYYWYCFPGCLPDSDPVGPFATEQKAIDAAQAEAMFD